MIEKSITILKELQHPSGLFSASKKEVSTGYNKAWIRDCIYESLGLEATKNLKEVKKAFWALFEIFLKHEYKIDHAIKQKPTEKYQYIHARYDPITFDEIYEDWGNKQNDAIGAFLFKVGELEEKGIKIIRSDVHRRILQKLVDYLLSIEYWQDKDNGMWEENEEVHASSVGACVAGLKKISKIVNVPLSLIKKGEETLNKLLPNESATKDCDLALLSLIYPYNIVSKEQAEQILTNIENKLVRKQGVIRYVGDLYYNNGQEPSWTMGFPWLAQIYKVLNKPDKYAYYMRKTLDVMTPDKEMPELYLGNSIIQNENTPLGWAQSMYLVAASA
ncbi:glycoside hydrolase family 15 [Candidatus Woesearchaeota archaeon]|jgi:GH15 family glucan-1,4-alpha-glucosidase|nr:glycoside hydrolase family 15 [Candidatus Woesearchaeota archaeon]MBT4368136.1 glycoside hydrolase family 15 [Candidatus Woesearchaeota archaeon]MBT4712624.1 glycoside hydrolase family 15 [Candidatus Woesearchaeota archaeon]MBT6639537.1 glycoside hydrolase family 15 [Candidatus Woesearchaeota archaeon]MBT7133709.1 glycoside hydrolase family 15 [Candidatus Woesearchaeota archaeon]